MLREKYEKNFFAASPVRFFLTPGETEANNFFSLVSAQKFCYTIIFIYDLITINN